MSPTGLRAAVGVLALAGFALGLFAVYLIVVQMAVLDAICVWRLVSDVIALALLVLGVLRLRAEPVAPDPA